MLKQKRSVNSRSTKIPDYFESRTVAQKPTAPTITESRSFIAQCLQEQQPTTRHENETERTTEDELIDVIEVNEDEAAVSKDDHIRQLKTTIANLTVQLQKTKKLYRTSLQMNLSKDLELKHMSNLLEEKGIVHTNFVPGNFDRFTDVFTSNEIVNLRSVGVNAAADATFVRLVLMYLHKADLGALAIKTLSGRNATSQLGDIESGWLNLAFDERLAFATKDVNARNDRKNGLRKLIANALHYIRRSGVAA